MPNFERNDLNLIEKKINDDVKHPVIGKVSQVYEHSAFSDDSNWEVDVSTDAGTIVEQRVPLHTIGNDSIFAPKLGDKIILFYIGGETKSPVAFGTGFSNFDRPPVGRAGMYRNRFESGDSPLGEGDLHLTGYTSYNESPASTDKRELDAEETFVQIAKHTEGTNVDPSTKDEIPFKLEVYDSPKNDAGHVEMAINGVNSNDTNMTWGFKLDFKTGEFKIVDPNGFGIKSDGYGNLTFEYKSLDKNEVLSGQGSLGL